MFSMVGTGAGHAGSAEGDWMMPPLSVLLKRELTNEQIEKSDILHGLASRSKKGEDLTFLKTECQRVPGNGATTFFVFAVLAYSLSLSLTHSFSIIYNGHSVNN